MADLKIKGLNDKLSLYVGRDLALRGEAGAMFFQDHSLLSLPTHSAPLLMVKGKQRGVLALLLIPAV